jgi:glutaminase
MNHLLQNILTEAYPYIKDGKLADYIPELAKADAQRLGLCLITNDAKIECVGDYNIPFTIQSIIKPIILLLAILDTDMVRVQNLVGVEATGKPFDAFNYSDQALTSTHINPMINAGAIALCTLIKGQTYNEKFARLLDFTKKLTNNSALEINRSVYQSEKATGNKNRALAYMLKAYNIIDADVEELLDFYFRACSVNVTCKDLAHLAFVLSNHGKDLCGNQLFPAEYARSVNAILTTCGMYDGSGEFALNVGIPAKSGVGGGIMAVVPKRMGIGIYSPALDSKGNSAAGKKVLASLSQKLNLSIF